MRKLSTCFRLSRPYLACAAALCVTAAAQIAVMIVPEGSRLVLPK